ncbi:ABC transporter substrate-binding protein [Amycolatopsis kentuckyensis]|uniref:ABC transporter substrate-binding protein n=1 Tax=Amycolatopsis kentuckyensis TaxID=218823 RepID=UPI00356934CE
MSVRRWKMLCCIASLAALGLSGCSALGGSSDEPAKPGAGGLEKTSLKVAIQPSVDAAPYWLAQEGEYFKREGLEVQTTLAENPAASLQKLVSGEADLAELTYPTFFVAAKKGEDIRLVADGTAATPKSNVLVTVPTSPVKSVNDLPGKRIAITSKNSTSELLTRSVMKDHGLDPSTVKWVYLPLPNMAQALKDNQVDAAYQPEPFASAAARTVGATPFIDVAGPSSSTQDFPILGYDAKREWTEKYPNTMAAFQRAMLKATRDANAARSNWEPLVIKNAKAEDQDVKLMTPPGFRSTLDARRIRRVVDLMSQLGVITGDLNVDGLIVKQVSP